MDQQKQNQSQQDQNRNRDQQQNPQIPNPNRQPVQGSREEVRGNQGNDRLRNREVLDKDNVDEDADVDVDNDAMGSE